MMDLAAVPILLVEVDSGLIRLANRRACELFEENEGDLEQRLLWPLYADEDRERAIAHSAPYRIAITPSVATHPQ